MNETLVGAIDGDNVAFAVATNAGNVRLDGVRHFKTTEFPTFIDALQNYTRSAGLSTNGLGLGLAVAGVSGGDVISFANCRWYVSVSGLRAFLRSEPLIINDFAATAWSVSMADPSQLSRIGAVTPRPADSKGTFLVVGTGPGLGMATVSVQPDGTTVTLESEGGHSSFAPQNETEDQVLATLRRKFGHVSYERLVSHAGLQNIYAALSEAAGRTVTPPHHDTIIGDAMNRSDPLAIKAAEIFVSALGSFVGNSVLNSGAWGGVFLISDMLREMLPLIERGTFRTQMAAKGRLARTLDRVPTSFVRSDAGALNGTAAALFARRAAA